MLDDEAFTDLLAAHRGMLLTRARRRAGPEDAEDLVSETLLRAWRARGRFAPDSPGGWLATILANAAIARARRKRFVATTLDLLPDPPDPRPDPPDPRPGPDDEALRRDLGEALARALATLPPDQRDAVLLCDRDGARNTEAAAILGIPAATVATRLYRGRQKLFGALAGAV